MEAGRALDAEVAEKVMGWQRVSVGELYFWPTDEMVADIRKRHPDVLPVNYFPAPEFSTDIAAAWKVVEHLWGDHWWIKVSGQHAPGNKPGWQCRMDDQLERRDPSGVVAHGDTAPLAICRAALAAVGAEMPAGG